MTFDRIAREVGYEGNWAIWCTNSLRRAN
jgi:hypothetical protein